MNINVYTANPIWIHLGDRFVLCQETQWPPPAQRAAWGDVASAPERGHLGNVLDFKDKNGKFVDFIPTMLSVI